ncbi:hypothetical protein OSI08_27100, partial [Mycobacterium ulcerans]
FNAQVQTITNCIFNVRKAFLYNLGSLTILTALIYGMGTNLPTAINIPPTLRPKLKVGHNTPNLFFLEDPLIHASPQEAKHGELTLIGLHRLEAFTKEPENPCI